MTHGLSTLVSPAEREVKFFLFEIIISTAVSKPPNGCRVGLMAEIQPFETDLTKFRQPHFNSHSSMLV